MGRLAIAIAIAFAIVFSLAGPASAQFANADLAGVVIDTDGASLPGVTVTTRSPGSRLFEWWGGISTRSIDVTVTSSQDNSEVLFLQTP